MFRLMLRCVRNEIRWEPLFAKIGKKKKLNYNSSRYSTSERRYSNESA